MGLHLELAFVSKLPTSFKFPTFEKNYLASKIPIIALSAQNISDNLDEIISNNSSSNISLLLVMAGNGG